MAKEIERKFLVKDDSFISMARECHTIIQAYLSRSKESTVRIRVRDSAAFLTIKGETIGMSRDEWEYPIPIVDAEEMIERLTAGKAIYKTRYNVDYENRLWEVDMFHGQLEGLCIAEVEIPSPEIPVSLPPFVGKEVTGVTAYYNSNLINGVIPHEE